MMRGKKKRWKDDAGQSADIWYWGYNLKVTTSFRTKSCHRMCQNRIRVCFQSRLKELLCSKPDIWRPIFASIWRPIMTNICTRFSCQSFGSRYVSKKKMFPVEFHSDLLHQTKQHLLFYFFCPESTFIKNSMSGFHLIPVFTLLKLGAVKPLPILPRRTRWSPLDRA